MPFKIVSQAGGGWKVCSQEKCFSKNPILKKKTAQKQRVAIALSEHEKTGAPMGPMFV